MSGTTPPEMSAWPHRGYGLTHGAVATTVAHDSHNLIVVGDNESDMLAAVREIERVQGGYTIAADGKILGTLPLPVAGLMSNETADTLIPALDGMIALAKKQGSRRESTRFITLSFMALPVIGDIRITDMGMFDVTKFSSSNEKSLPVFRQQQALPHLHLFSPPAGSAARSPVCR